MDDRFSRSELLLGKGSTEKLNSSKVMVVGLGGVGSFVVEALARAGVGKLCLVDGDVYSVSNLNRQLYATSDTIGEKKVFAAKKRIEKINPDCVVTTFPIFFDSSVQNNFDFKSFDYIVDAIDSVESKTSLILCAENSGVPIISCMGAGNKTDPTLFRVADIYETSVCPLARTMRSKLKVAGIKSLKVVYSKENPVKPQGEVVGSVPFVPAVAGFILAGEVIKDIIKD